MACSIAAAAGVLRGRDFFFGNTSSMIFLEVFTHMISSRLKKREIYPSLLPNEVTS